MPTKKEALLSAGRIQAITRGRISRENHEWLNAHPELWDDVSVVPEPFKAPRVTASVPKPTPVGYSYDITYTYPEDGFKAIGLDGTPYGMREVCNTCRVSLVCHACLNPTILEGIAVKIVPR